MANLWNLEEFIRALDSWGLTDVMLPFLLIFTLIFAILVKSRILGEGKRNFNLVIALVIALLVVVPHVTNSYPPNADIVEIINASVPGVSVVLVAILMLLILIGLFGGGTNWGSQFSGWVAVISFIIILAIFGAAAGWWTGWNWLTNFFGEDAVALVVILLVFGLIIAFVTGGEGAEKAGGGALNRFMGNIADFFKRQ